MLCKMAVPWLFQAAQDVRRRIHEGILFSHRAKCSGCVSPMIWGFSSLYQQNVQWVNPIINILSNLFGFTGLPH